MTEGLDWAGLGTRLLLEQLPAVAWTTDNDLRFTTSTGAGLAALGLAPGQVVGMLLEEYFGPDSGDTPAMLAHKAALRGVSSSYEFAWLEVEFGVHVQPLRDDQETIIGTVGVALDITERRRTEEALRASQRRLAHAQRIAQMGSWDWKIGTNDVHWSDEVFRVIGIDPELVPSSLEAFLAVVHPDDVAFVQESIEASVRTGTEYRIEHRVVLPTGEIRFIQEHGEIIKDAEGTPTRMLGTILDVTDRRRAEAQRDVLQGQLRHQQKLESIGTLASGVAHEINNPVQAILSYAELTQASVDPESDVARHVGEIVRGTERVAEIVRNLLAFARNEHTEAVQTCMAEATERTLSLMRAVLRSDQIDLRVDVAEKPIWVRGRPQQLQQVVMNLVTNARDALNETYPEDHENKFIEVVVERIQKNGEVWVRTSVQDGGPGVETCVVDRIFDPFFTTKDSEHGTGLGLSVSHGIVTQHGGKLGLDPDTSAGARFLVDLPALDVPQAS